MRIIARRTLKEYWDLYPECEEPLKIWYRETTKAQWKNPADIRQEYGSSSILRNNRVVFNIKGNKYRLIVRINYDFALVWIRFIGSHAEYDRIDASTI
jgi:mRNA interferase HigB